MRIKKYICVTIILCLFILTAPLRNSAAEHLPSKITLGLGQPKNTMVAKVLRQIYTEAFGRLGIKFELKYYPAKRCSLMSDEGITDGEAWRIYNYNEKHPRLIRVETPSIEIRFVAYTKKGRGIVNLNGWERLKDLDTDIIINTRRGQKKTMDELKKHGFVLQKNWYLINKPESAIRKLLTYEQRVDIYIEVDWVIEQVVRDNGIKGVNEAGVMETVNSYMFLHERHRALAPKIAHVLKEMHEEGLIAKWVKQVKNR